MSRSWLLYLDDLIESAEKIGRLAAIWTRQPFALPCSFLTPGGRGAG